MKKIFLSLMLGLGLANVTIAAPQFTGGQGNGGPFISAYGSSMKNGSALSLGLYPGSVAPMAFAGTAGNAITVNWPVVLTSVTVTPSGIAAYIVSPTATAGDKTYIGIALNTAAVGETVFVAFAGPALATTGVGLTKGDLLITSGTAGNLTKASSVTEASYTAMSTTAIVGRAMETVSGAGLVRVFLGK